MTAETTTEAPRTRAAVRQARRRRFRNATAPAPLAPVTADAARSRERILEALGGHSVARDKQFRREDPWLASDLEMGLAETEAEARE